MSGTNFSVVSWNVNSVKARLEHVLRFLKERNPDVLCLQELKCEESAFPLLEIQSLGYSAAIYGQKTYNGVAILSKIPLSDVCFGFEGEKIAPSARLISGSLGKLTLYSVYVPNGQEVGSEKYFEKLQFLKALKEVLKIRHPNQPFIVCGDFNVAPQDEDVHDPETWRGQLLCSDRERKGLSNLVTEVGLIDTYRHLHPKGRDYSWWDYRGFAFQKNAGLRIDFVYGSSALTAYVKEAGVVFDERQREKPSDHAPVYCHFLIPKELLLHQIS